MNYSFKVPFLPISINRLYSWNSRTRSMYMTEEGRHYKTCLKMACPPMSFKAEHPLIDIKIEYHSPRFICKNGRYRKIDGANMDKLVHDAVSERIGIDDAFFFHWAGSKVIDQEEYTLVEVKEAQID